MTSKKSMADMVVIQSQWFCNTTALGSELPLEFKVCLKSDWPGRRSPWSVLVSFKLQVKIWPRTELVSFKFL